MYSERGLQTRAQNRAERGLNGHTRTDDHHLFRHACITMCACILTRRDSQCAGYVQPRVDAPARDRHGS